MVRRHAAGQAIRIRKQPLLGGVGGSPWVAALFRLVSGDTVSDGFLPGRCAQLGS
jgi:hypothetical protein